MSERESSISASSSTWEDLERSTVSTGLSSASSMTSVFSDDSGRLRVQSTLTLSGDDTWSQSSTMSSTAPLLQRSHSIRRRPGPRTTGGGLMLIGGDVSMKLKGRNLSLMMGSGTSKTVKQSWRRKGTRKHGSSDRAYDIPEWKEHHRRIDCRPGMANGEERTQCDTFHPSQPGPPAYRGFKPNSLMREGEVICTTAAGVMKDVYNAFRPIFNKNRKKKEEEKRRKIFYLG